MVKVDEYARIRRAHFVDGLGIKSLSRLFHHSRRKIREILATPEPKSYARLNPAVGPGSAALHVTYPAQPLVEDRQIDEP
jgi:hypothetical protein